MKLKWENDLPFISVKLVIACSTIDLKHAIDANKLSLYYQPIIDLGTNQVHGVEALARWEHLKHGMILPNQFIPLAENKGFIQQLTLWVLDVACKQCAEWHKAGIKIKISINLSPRNFLDPSLPEAITTRLENCKLDPKWIKLEITENMAMSQPEKAIEIISCLKNLGLGISIDDFGTGYSSLSSLTKLPVTEFKIDESFVMNMDKDPGNKVIVSSTINLAHELGLDVVAEGVESQEVLQILQDLGCNRGQGYYFCRPKPAEEISRWLCESEWRQLSELIVSS